MEAIINAMEILTKAINEDLDYAWAWHCNIAMAAYDAGCDQKIANDGAARFMKVCFGIDTSIIDPAKLIRTQGGGNG